MRGPSRPKAATSSCTTTWGATALRHWPCRWTYRYTDDATSVFGNEPRISVNTPDGFGGGFSPDHALRMADLAVSLHIPGDGVRPSQHGGAQVTSYLAANGTGDVAADESAKAFTRMTTSMFWLKAIDVSSSAATGSIVATFTVPGAGGAQGNPTGLVFNGGSGFVVNNGVGAPSATRFIFSSEDGTISAWNPNTTNAQIVADRSGVGAVYKGAAIVVIPGGALLFATDFRNNRVLEALQITRAGGNAPLFDQMFRGLTIGSGVVGVRKEIVPP